MLFLNRKTQALDLSLAARLGNTGNPVFNRMWTLLGVPCLTLPARWAENKLPTGVQLVGRIGDDARLMACAAFLESALAALR